MKKVLFLLLLVPVSCFAENRYTEQAKKCADEVGITKQGELKITEKQLYDMRLSFDLVYQMVKILKEKGLTSAQNIIDELDSIDKALDEIDNSNKLTLDERLSLIQGELSLLKMKMLKLEATKNNK